MVAGSSSASAFGRAEYCRIGCDVGLDWDDKPQMRLLHRERVSTKNSLAKIAAKGTAYEQIGDMLTGPVALASSVDPVAAAKVLNDFAKTNDKLVLKAGSISGKVLDKAGVQALASIPSREELLGKLLGIMQAPVTGFACALAALAKQREEAVV